MKTSRDSLRRFGRGQMFLPLGRTLAGLAILFFWSQSMAFERDLIRAWNTHTTKARQALERYQTEAGLAEFEAALKAAEQLGGKEAYRLVNTLDELGFTYLDNGRLEDAERVILRAKQIKERDFPKHERYQLTGMFLEGLLYAHLGEIEKGEAMVRQIEKRAAFVSGGFGFGVALCEACLADAYARNDRFAEAEALYQKAIRKFLNPTTQSGWVMRFDNTPEVVTERPRPDYRSAVSVSANLAKMYARQGRQEEADAAFEAAIDLFEKDVGRKDARVLQLLVSHAEEKRRDGITAKSIAAYQRALEASARVYGKDSVETLPLLKTLVDMQIVAGKEEGLDALCERLVKVTEKSMGAKHPDTADALRTLGERQIKNSRLKDAEKSLRRSLAIDEETRGATNMSLLPTLKLLITLYTGQRRDAELDQMLQKQIVVLEGLFGSRSPAVVTVLENRLKVLERLGRQSEAAALATKIGELRSGQTGN